MTLLDNFSKKRAKPTSYKQILAEAYRLRHQQPISIAFLMRKFQINFEQAHKIKHQVYILDSKDPAWYPGKPVEESKEDLDAFIKRITPKRK